MNDSIDVVLDVAADVLRDYLAPDGRTRLERLARWVCSQLGGAPYAVERAGGVAFVQLPHMGRAWRVGERVGLTSRDSSTIEWPRGGMSVQRAREVAVALLRLCELHEDDD